MDRQAERELMDLPAEAEAYARADFAGVNQAFAERLAELASQSGLVADLGTGPGDIPLRLVKLRPAWKVIGVDGAPAMLKHAAEAVRRAGLEQAISLVLADAGRLPFGDGAFDVVCSNSLLHHVSDPSALWREMRRILRPGGTVLVRDLMRPASESTARDIVRTYAGSESELLKEEFFRSLLAAYTVAEVRAQLDAAGLTEWSVAPVSDRHLDVISLP